MMPRDGDTLRVVSYNVHACIGTDGHFSPERIVALIDSLDADIVALQEVEDCPFGETTVVPYLADSLGLKLCGRTSFLRNGIDYGNLLLTRWESTNSAPLDLAVPGREPRGAIVADIEPHGRKVRVLNTHFGLSFRERRRQVRALTAAIAKTDADLTVLCADFNEWLPGSAVHRRLRQSLGPTIRRKTFPSRFPIFSLDRIYASPRSTLLALTSVNSRDARLASDHLPLVADLSLAGL